MSSAVSPVAGYTAWYNPTTIQQSGGNVTGWNDASINAFNFTSAFNSPAYSASTINGLPGIVFTAASSQYLTSGATLANLIGASSSTFTAYTVCKLSSFTGASVFGGQIFSDSAGVCQWGDTSAANSEIVFSAIAAVGVSSSTAITIILEVYYDGVNQHLRVNGVNASPVAATGAIVTTGTLFCGRSGTGGTIYFDGTICEMIFYSSVLSGANMTTNRSYLATKYAGTG